MRVYLDRFSVPGVVTESCEISSLVNRNSTLLGDDRPDTIRRYRDLPHAARFYLKSVATRNFNAYVVREEDKHGRARGIATRIIKQSVIHPGVGSVYGDNLDYWIDDDSDKDLHAGVAWELVYASAKRAGFRPTYDHMSTEASKIRRVAHPRVFVAVTQSAQHPPIGLMGDLAPGFAMEKVGEPAALTLPRGQEDRFGLTGGGETIQIYHGVGQIHQRTT